jgi:anti-sigma regulatory factor (Ser/Thr protein kinase)
MPLILQTGPDGEHKGLDGASRLRRLHRPFDQAKLLDIVSVALRERVYCRQFKADTGELREATFTFQTIHSARDLAILLAATFPEPQRVVVGLTELLLNAVEHGNLGIGYGEKNRLRHEGRWELEVAARAADPANTGKEVWVEYLHEPRHIKVRIRDQGDGFDWRSYLDMDPARVNELHGRGIAIARMISFDSLEYRGNGNEVEVAVEIPAR